MKSSPARRAIATLLLAVVAASCGGNEVAKADIETRIGAQLASQLNQPVPDITCPGPLKAEVGATLDCTLKAQGDETLLPVHVVVTSTDDDTKELQFTAEVGDEPVS